MLTRGIDYIDRGGGADVYDCHRARSPDFMPARYGCHPPVRAQSPRVAIAVTHTGRRGRALHPLRRGQARGAQTARQQALAPHARHADCLHGADARQARGPAGHHARHIIGHIDCPHATQRTAAAQGPLQAAVAHIHQQSRHALPSCVCALTDTSPDTTRCRPSALCMSNAPSGSKPAAMPCSVCAPPLATTGRPRRASASAYSA